MARVRAPGGTLPGAQDARPVRRVAVAVAVLLLVIGVLGFVPGVTSDLDQLKFAGQRSDAQLFGVFAVSALINVLHLSLGVIGLFSARTNNGASLFLVVGGIALGVLVVYGGLVGEDSSLNVLSFNVASTRMHLALGLLMIVLGVALSPRARKPSDA